jgi:hypothetical protein
MYKYTEKIKSSTITVDRLIELAEKFIYYAESNSANFTIHYKDNFSVSTASIGDLRQCLKNNPLNKIYIIVFFFNSQKRNLYFKYNNDITLTVETEVKSDADAIKAEVLGFFFNKNFNGFASSGLFSAFVSLVASVILGILTCKFVADEPLRNAILFVTPFFWLILIVVFEIFLKKRYPQLLITDVYGFDNSGKDFYKEAWKFFFLLFSSLIIPIIFLYV